ncbi:MULTISPECIES: electron transfer flavoprotein subunit alpha/FixB family protein [Paenibacillus]|jgi:electron transfer flavoprotein alpha subunit|uniref:electron transfer flavoprotein subunit alpha/FixB family protein n=1 Tax=Paenibacillus TaxID=44249 RepID=UPI00048DA9B9|nr:MULTISPECIES: electron transfer flavoprotein subunit alpha/FixB family protein [Paenibacillus]MEC2344480.1 electron transfer flavoprotein subunit alpha/FixB family protein [Paenibacillus barengoltzii]SMF29338.1 electron transfer flavoprotein alpha subunit apoprotein [Paenibacillus barengoltzii]
MSKTYVVIVETKDGKLRQVSLEALHVANTLRGESDRLTAVLLGHQLDDAAAELSRHVEGQVLILDHAELHAYQPELAFEAVLQALAVLPEEPRLILLGHTAIGRDLAPQLAAQLNCGQISDVTSLTKDGDRAVFTRPLYAGKAFEQKELTDGTGIVTIRPNNFSPAAPAAAPGTLVPLEFTAPATLHTILKDVVRKVSGKVDLTEAKIVVSGGRGVKSADGFKVLEELADTLGGAVGASRGACDAGYCDYALQIGQTGKVVTPEIYIACGISGAIQHLAGMSQSRVIIAINKDPEAPIFKVADYGIVGDLFEIVPLLTEQFKEVLAERTS